MNKEHQKHYEAERKFQSDLMKRDLDRQRLLEELFRGSNERIQEKIDQFYIRYANKEKLTVADVRKMAKEMDVKAFNARAKKAVEERDFSHETNQFLKPYNLKMNVSRLELLKADLNLDMQELYANAYDLMDKARIDEQKQLIEHLKEQSGVLRISGVGLASRLKAIRDADFYGQTFAKSVWGNNGLHAQLQQDVFGSLGRIYTDMMGYKQERTRLSKKYNTSLHNANRLLNTEISRIQAQTQLEMLRENDFTHMIYVAESGACDRCGQLNGKAIPIDDIQIGYNYFPMHPNCRCSAYGHIKMDYKSGGSTLDQEAKNGVWERENADDSLHSDMEDGKIKIDKDSLQNQFSYFDDGIEKFIPTNTIFENTKIIAGFGSDKELRIAEKLAQTYGGQPEDWSKRVGKIESDRYIFDMHWYENKNDFIQKDMKMKFRKEK